MLSSILIISWDTAVRSESEPFGWAEKFAQHYKEANPDLYLDYIDLHQDALAFPLDSDAQIRFDHAQLVCLIINAQDSSLPGSIQTTLAEVTDYAWGTSKRFIFTKKDQSAVTGWSLINTRKELVEQLAALEG